MKYFLVILAVLSTCILFGNHAYAMWDPLSPEELLTQSGTIFVGTITAVTPMDVEYKSQIASDGTIKQSVGPETLTLDKYSVNVEEFLQNPQNNDTVTLLQATVGGVPGVPAMIKGFEIGDRVLFYLPKDQNQVYFPGEYLPESFKIPKYCDAKAVLEQPKIIGNNSFGISQDGILKEDNFTAGKPMKFVFNKDTATLFGSSFDVDVAISKESDEQVIFQKNIHSESKPCQWITSAEWEFTPEEGHYRMHLAYTEYGGTSTLYSGFSVRPAISSEEIIKGIPHSLPVLHNMEDLEQLSRYTLKGTIFGTKRMFDDNTTNTQGADAILINIDNRRNNEYTIQFNVKYYTSIWSPPKSIESHNRFDVGQEVSVFLIKGHGSNSYAGFVTDGYLVSEGMAYNVTSTKQPSPLVQHQSGVFSRSVNCNEGLELLIKQSDGQPVCVKPLTKEKLVQLGWAKPTPIEDVSSSKYAEIDVVKKLLSQNQIEYLPDKIIVASGPGFDGDPRCGAVLDVNSVTHWFGIDSISKPQKMTLFSENPNPCKVNSGSCFCNAQMELTALTLDKMSYFNSEEEEKVANMLIDYLGKENINRTPKFLIGKFNLNYTEPSAIGYCGELWGYNKYDFFVGGIVNDQVKDYGLAKELSPLCAISKNAKWWEKK